MSPEDFYSRRDDRTEQCVGPGDYQKRSCCVVIDTWFTQSHGGQIAAIATCDLLARWCRTVTIVVPGIPLVPALTWLGADLGEAILARMREADPFGTFDRVATAPDGADFYIALGVAQPLQAHERTTYVAGTGWWVSVSDAPQNQCEPAISPVAALVAAALGVARVFMLAIGTRGALDHGAAINVYRMSAGPLDSGPPFPEVVEVGALLCIGAGAVASSTLYGLALVGVCSAVTIVDRDTLGIENIARQPTATVRQAGQPKADALAASLAGSSLIIVPRSMWWDEFTSAHGETLGAFDVWLPLANERNVRASVQANVPPLQVHASTARDWQCSFGRHIPELDDCLVERFPDTSGAAPFLCSSGDIVVRTGKRADAALPFLSLLAGTLVVADLVRLSMTGYPQVDNMLTIDLKGDTLNPQRLARSRTPACPACGYGFTRRVRGETRYAHLLSMCDRHRQGQPIASDRCTRIMSYS